MEIFGLGPVYNGSLFRTSKENEYWWAARQNMTGQPVMENTREGKWPAHHCASTMHQVSDNHLASFTHLRQWCQMVATFLIDFNGKQISCRDTVSANTYLFSDYSLVTWYLIFVDILLAMYLCRYLSRYLARYLARYLGHQEGVMLCWMFSAGAWPWPAPSHSITVSLLHCRHL